MGDYYVDIYGAQSEIIFDNYFRNSPDRGIWTGTRSLLKDYKRYT